MCKSRISEDDRKRRAFIDAAGLMQESLSRSTGLPKFERKVGTYWTIATHTLSQIDVFPILLLLGPMGTGKTKAGQVVANFAYRPRELSLRAMTGPAIRDAFAQSHEGTVVIEEADSAWKDKDGTFEGLISDRYQRGTAKAFLKAPNSDGYWETVERVFFGATAVHRRISFADAALDGRSIRIRFRADHSRKYEEFNAKAPCNLEGRNLIGTLTYQPPAMEQPDGVAARVFNSYRPILSAAKFCGDEEFLEEVLLILRSETRELKDAQCLEPDGLVLLAIVEAVLETGVPNWQTIKYSDIARSIWDSHRVPLLPRQIGSLARGLGFETKVSHGTYVVLPTPATLIRACDRCGYTDDSIEELRRQRDNLG